MDYNMIQLFCFFTTYLLFQPIKAGFINCNEPNITKQQICKVNEISIKDLSSNPDFLLSPQLMELTPKVTINSIPEFNENDGTITINSLFKLIWNDTRCVYVKKTVQKYQ